MRIKRSDLIREPYDRDASFFRDYSEHEDKKYREEEHEGTAANKNVASSSTTGASESRTEIGNRLVDRLNYLAARRLFSRHSSATRRAQKSRAALRGIIAARNVELRIANDIDERRFDLAAREKRRDAQDKPENLSEQCRVKDGALGELDENISARNHQVTSVTRDASSSAKIPQQSRLDLPGSTREGMEMDRETVAGLAPDERSAVIERVIALVREITPNPARSARADYLSSAAAKEREPTARILSGCARSPGSPDRNVGETDTGVVKSTAVSDMSFQKSISEDKAFCFSTRNALEKLKAIDRPSTVNSRFSAGLGFFFNMWRISC